MNTQAYIKQISTSTNAQSYIDAKWAPKAYIKHILTSTNEHTSIYQAYNDVKWANYDANYVFFSILFQFKGTSAYAGPYYHKLYGRVTHVWGNRKSQPNQSAMKWSRLGRSPALIRFASPSGKYDLNKKKFKSVAQ